MKKLVSNSEKKVTLVNLAVQKELGFDSPMLLDIEKYTESLEVFRAEGSRRPVEEAPSLRALKGKVVQDQEEIIRIPATGELSVLAASLLKQLFFNLIDNSLRHGQTDKSNQNPLSGR